MGEPSDLLGLDGKGAWRHHVIRSLCRCLDGFTREERGVRTKSGEVCSSSALPKGSEGQQRDSHPQAGPSAESEVFITRMYSFCNKNVNVYIIICTEQLYSVPHLSSENTLG